MHSKVKIGRGWNFIGKHKIYVRYEDLEHDIRIF